MGQIALSGASLGGTYMGLTVFGQPALARARLIFLTFLTFALIGTSSAVAKPPFSAVAVDARNGKVLSGSNVDSPRHPASLTKMMTLYIVFQELKAGRIKLSTDLVVSGRAAGMAPSKLGLKPGSRITVENAIKALVTKSANDVAATVAENLGGSESNFAARMTKTARGLGMSKTTFLNASGLPNPGQWTTARDMATLGLRIQRDFPQYYPYFRLTTFIYKGRIITTHNRLLGRYAGTDGIKTGYIRASGFNLVTSAKRGDRRVVGVVMGGRSGGSRNAYMMAMLNSVFPKCTSGTTIAAAAGSSSGAITPETSVATPKAKPMLAATAAAKDPTPSQDADAEASALQTVTADESSSAPETQVLEAKIGGAVEMDSEPEDGAVDAESTEEAAAPALPEKLPFAIKPKAQGGETVIAASDENAWAIQIGAFPEKDAAERKLADVLSSNSDMLAGKPALTIEVPGNKGKKIFRARFSGFTQAAAKSACRHLSRKGMDCMPMSPQS
jgi:D-alanyl-D-alanine carboxypeptidase